MRDGSHKVWLTNPSRSRSDYGLRGAEQLQRVEQDGVTVAVRDGDGALAYIDSTNRVARELASAEGRDELIPERAGGYGLRPLTSLLLWLGGAVAGAVVGRVLVREVKAKAARKRANRARAKR